MFSCTTGDVQLVSATAPSSFYVIHFGIILGELQYKIDSY